MKKLYIAYGSNMDEDQMAFRCPGAELLGITELEGYELLFKGSLTGAYATIEPANEGKVPVLIWEIDQANEASLDRYEGYPHFYYKKELDVQIRGEIKKAMAYIMHENKRLGEPSTYYYNVLKKAYQKFGFDMSILKKGFADSCEGVCL